MNRFIEIEYEHSVPVFANSSLTLNLINNYSGEYPDIIDFLNWGWESKAQGGIRSVNWTIKNIHTGSRQYLSGTTVEILENKINRQLKIWFNNFEKDSDKETELKNEELAASLTKEAKQTHESFKNILNHTLSIDDKVNWQSLIKSDKYKYKSYSISKPKKPNLNTPLQKPCYLEPKVPFFAKLFGNEKLIKETAKKDFSIELKSFENKKLKYNKKISDWNKQVNQWNDNKIKWDENESNKAKEHEENKERYNNKIKKLENDWALGEENAVIDHAYLVLESSQYPDEINLNFLVQYSPNKKLMKIECGLPITSIVKLPKQVKYIKKTDEFKTTLISKADQKKLYDDILYQIALRTIHEIYESDESENIVNLLFNGVVIHNDPATGKETKSTVMSAMFEKEEFLSINLSSVDFKACFKNFKGISALSLINLSPIAPLITMDQNDSRIINTKNISSKINKGTNLASMSWEDFEHLVANIFEKELGYPVKTTQTSSDGGVDAIGFDPDPIQGGKVIIQAKRYTRTVGISAVRELHGQMKDEGAKLGLLVTTADFGAQAVKFAANKPINLINGNNLLYLMNKFGITAYIDIADARKQLSLSK